MKKGQDDPFELIRLCMDDSWSCSQCTRDNIWSALQCASCQTQRFPPSFLVPLDLRQLAYVAQACKHPLVLRWSDLDTLVPQNKDEFSFAPVYHPQLVVAVTQKGFFPMTSTVWDVPIMAIKLHVERCVCDTLPFVTHKTTLKKSKRFAISLNSSFDRVIQMIEQQQERNWLCPALARSLKHIMTNPNDPKFGGALTRVFSWEVWAGDELAAVEVGYVVGTIYTSMTGAFDPKFKGAGTVQLACMSAILKKVGVELVDFGMHMPYKEGLGGRKIPRAEWLKTVQKLRTKAAPNFDKYLEGRTNCQEILREK